MKIRISTFLFIAILGSFFLFANLALAQSSEDHAASAIESWLTLVDDEKYEGSWKAASSYLSTACVWLLREQLGIMPSGQTKNCLG